MSTRADNYLSLCLEQASKSPQHYRHGCIIVRGGKVIGSGFNDNRSGFSGGALKTGKLPGGALDGQALKGLKSKLKRKCKSKHSSAHQSQATSTFTPYEANGSGAGMGGGPHANIPLTMHSEMMAIQNALAVSSTSAHRAQSFEKPCWKLPSDSKRKLRLRREVLTSYVQQVCEDAIAIQGGSRQSGQAKQRSEGSRVQASQFEPRVSQPGAARERDEWIEREEEQEKILQRFILQGKQQLLSSCTTSGSEYCVRPYDSTRTTTPTTAAAGVDAAPRPAPEAASGSSHPSRLSSASVCV